MISVAAWLTVTAAFGGVSTATSTPQFAKAESEDPAGLPESAVDSQALRAKALAHSAPAIR
ncbi:hypothetical protein GCM10027298_01430 [Epidermidibacterium keratini]